MEYNFIGCNAQHCYIPQTNLQQTWLHSLLVTTSTKMAKKIAVYIFYRITFKPAFFIS
jgi:hypothetical protein